jgi:OmcA/MtrC family decaheme c-type cytochrome
MFNVRRIVPLFFMFSVLAIAGCSGDDGKDGAAGPTGPTGPSGPPGTDGGTALPFDSSDVINVETTNVDIPAGGSAPTVYVTLTNDLGLGLKGLPAGDIRFTLAQLTPGTNGGSSEWQNYFTTASGGIPNAQGTTETATAGTFVDNGDGTYEYTFANDLTAYPGAPVFDATKTHRLGIEIRGPAATITSNGIYDFVPAGGAPTFERKIVDNDTCDACHDRLEFHGGPRTDVEYCVTCHNPHSIDGDTGNTVDMKALIHNIHSGRDGYVIIGYGGSVHDYSDVVWSQDIRNCQTCHEESDANTPQASNYRLVPNRAACGTCHYDDGDPNNGEHDYAIEAGMHPGGLSFNDDSQCIDCHGPDATINNGDVRVVNAHKIPLQIESERFAYNIVDVSNMAVGSMPTVQFSVTDPTNGDAPYDILNDTEFTTCAGGNSRLAISIAWDTADYSNTGSGADPAQPISLNPLSCGSTPATPVAGSAGVFEITSSTPIPANAAGTTAAVTIDGHPAVDVNGTVMRIPVHNVVEYVGVDGASAVPRRVVVNVDKCDDCHKQLTLHGNNRTDNPQVCVICHNPNATDVGVRAAPCTDTLGTDDTPIDLKYMVHAIHASGETGVAYNVCGYGNSAHTFSVEYPGHINDCEGCHYEGTYYPVDPDAVHGTTVDTGADPSTPVDDTVVSPNTSVCSACHVSDLAKQHMMQNGGDFAATKAADSTLISSGVETCQLCHGEGRAADVEVMHHVSDYQYN